MRFKVFALFLLLCIQFLSCSKKESKHVQPSDFGISAYTSGFISRESTIRVIFADPIQLDSTEFHLPLPHSPFTFVPSIKGTAVWTDCRTLEFRPSEQIRPGQNYTASLNVSVFLENRKKTDIFRFSFTVMKQAFEIVIEGLSPINPRNLSLQQFKGKVQTADVEDGSRIEKMVEARVKGKNLRPIWNHSPDGRKHIFTVDNIIRGEDSSTVFLTWSGKPIGVDKEGKYAIGVPSINSFTVTQIRPVQESESYLEIRFSDPLDESQNFSGLVTVDSKSDLRFTISNNIVAVYSASGWAGVADVKVEPGIRNSMGRKLKQGRKERVVFEEIKPTVRFSGKGVIVPTTQGLTIPIEAVNLKAVIVKAYRIYENNIPQFLQVNDLDGGDELTRVGRVAWKKTVSLDPSPDMRNRWIHYGLDLGPLVSGHPTGLYRLELSFKRNHIVYECSDTTSASDNQKEDEIDSENQDEEVESDNWDYYDKNGNYNWDEWYSQRENPCHEAYYRQMGDHDIQASRNILISDIGMIADKGAGDTIGIVVTNLKTAGPLSGVTVNLLDYQQQLISSGKTDRKGMLRLAFTRKPYLAEAINGNQKGWLRIDDESAQAIGRFDVGGESVQKGIKGFLYGERGVWRPGDTLFLTFILHDPDNRLPADHPVTLELYNSRSRLVRAIKALTSLNGFYVFKIPTNPSDPTGHWLAKVKAGGAVFEKQLKVETIMPNRLKIALDFGKQSLLAGDRIKGILSAQWLHGAPASNLDADIELTLNKTATTFAGYNDYVFDDPGRRYEPESFSMFKGTLDKNGKAETQAEVDAKNIAPGMLKADFRARVFEPGGAFSVDRFSIPYYPYKTFIGLKMPEVDRSRGMLLTDTTHVAEIAAVCADGRPAPKTRVEVKMYQIEWRWWWEKGEESPADYISSSSYTPIKCDTVTVVNGKGRWRFRIDQPSWGRFYIRATDLEGGHGTGAIVYIDWPGWAGRARNDQDGGATMLNFSTDKTEYKTGETVTVSIPSSNKGRCLVSLENGSRIIKQEWVEGVQGTTRYKFSAAPEMAPNIYVHVTYLQPHLTAGNDLPIRMYGIIPVSIIDPSTRLTPVIEAPDVFTPERKAKVRVSESSGRQMTYTLAVVDEGLLDLTRFATPDPWGEFYKREALGVKTWDLFDQVSGAYGATLEKLLAIGGDEEGGARGQKQANRFPPMVRFYGPFNLQKNKANVHDIDIPQYVGSVRVMVVAGQSEAFGRSEKNIPVRKPLMLLGTLPRVLSTGETADLPVSVFSLDPKVKDVNVSVSSKGPLSISGDSRKELTFKTTGDRLISFSAKASSYPGNALVTIKAWGAGETAEQTIELNIRVPVGPVVDVVDTSLLKGGAWKKLLAFPGTAGTNKVTLEMSRIPPLNLAQRLNYLIQYPHGCVEQTTSSVFPQLYLDKLIDVSPKYRASIESNIKAGIDHLRMFQTSDGGFGYWPGDGTSDEWASCYAGHFLIEAQTAGYLVPAGVIDQWIFYQQNKARAWVTGPRHSELIQSYRLYTLALSRHADLSSMNRLREVKDLDAAEKWRLAAAYQMAGQPEAALELTKNASLNVPRYRELSDTYGSDLRDKAMILEALVLMKKMDKTFGLVKELSNALGKDSWWLSTQTTAYALIALARHAGVAGANGDMKFAVSWNGSNEKQYTSSKPIMQIPLETGGKKAASIQIKNTGTSMIYPRVIMRGTPTVGKESPSSNGLSLEVAYKDVDGNPVKPSSIDQGKDLLAILTVKNTGISGDYKELALSYLVPSGWEIHNNRLDPSTKDSSSRFDYQDIRDDRIYTYFDLKQGETRTFRSLLNASYSGKFYLPMISVEAMYDATINARKPGEWITVVKQGND